MTMQDLLVFMKQPIKLPNYHRKFLSQDRLTISGFAAKSCALPLRSSSTLVVVHPAIDESAFGNHL